MTLNSSTSKIGFLLHMFLLFSSTLSTSLNTSELEVFGVFIEEHKAVCPVYGTCGVGLPFDIPLSCCGYCSCEPDCEKFGNCCPEYYQSFSEGMNLVARNKFKCVALQYISKGSEYVNKEFAWMVDICPFDVADSRNTELCENPGKEDLLETLIPVTDIGTNTVYRNKYCAYCSGLSDSSLLVEWKVEIHNDIYLNVPDDNLLQKIRDDMGNIFYKPPVFVMHDDCKIGDSYSISACNVSGKWAVYNESLERACAAFIDPFNSTYQNFFCYLCNSPSPPTHQSNWTCSGRSSDITQVSPPFLAILDVSEATGYKEVEKALTCSADQFSDMKKGVCRDILCHENRQMQQGICVYPEQANRDCSYSIFLNLTPVDGMLSLVDITSISNISLLTYLSSRGEVEFQVYGESNASDMFCYIVVYLVVKTQLDVIQTFIDLDKTNLNVYTKSGEIFKQFHVNFGLYDIEHTGKDSFVSLFDEKDFTKHILSLIYEEQYGNATCKTGQRTVLNRLTLCPYVVFEMTEIDVTLNEDIVTINGGWANTTDDVKLTRWEYELHGDKIHVCLDTFIYIYNKIPNDERLEFEVLEGVGAKQIVSFVCVCLSLVCLVLTIFTYLRFTKLQSQPGMNTIILCWLLFLAQSLYQFGAGQRSLSKWACAVIGALCHFLWLSVMFAMNTCSIHMFTIFKKHRQMLPRFRWQTTAKGILYIVGFSMSCVILNIVISFTIMNDRFGGYGGNVCYISSGIMQVITFLIPVAVTLTVNLLLFAYVVLRISKTRSSPATNLNQERNYFLIYVRLSTLTGLTWIFGFLRLFLNLDFLEYIFIILNAGQGIFIMVAFVLNKRVLSMYFGKGKAADSDQTAPSTVAIEGGDIKQTEVSKRPLSALTY